MADELLTPEERNQLLAGIARPSSLPPGINAPVVTTSAQAPADNHDLMAALNPGPGAPRPPAMISRPDTAATPPSAPPVSTPPVAKGPDFQAQIATELAKQQGDRAAGSGLHQLHDRIGSIENPWLRGAARVGEGLLHVGDIAGTMIAPAAMAAIPGSSLHHSFVLGQDNFRLKNDMGLQDQQAQIATRQSEVPKNAALAREADAKATEALNPAPKTNEERTLHDFMTGNNGAPQVNPKTNQPYTYPEAFAETERLKLAGSGKAGVPLGAKVPQLNSILKTVWERMHPGQAIDPSFALPADATDKDYERIDSALKHEIDASQNVQFKQQAEADRRVLQSIAVANLGLHQQAAADTHQEKTSQQEKPYKDVLDKVSDAHESAKDKTGPADYQVLMAFVEATKPSSGFRFTEAERKLIQGARSMANDAEGLYEKAAHGRIFVDDQVNEMLRVMDRVAQHSQTRLDEMKTKGSGGGGGESGKAVSLKAAMGLSPNKGKSEADVRADIQAHGHKVVE